MWCARCCARRSRQEGPVRGPFLRPRDRLAAARGAGHPGAHLGNSCAAPERPRRRSSIRMPSSTSSPSVSDLTPVEREFLNELGAYIAARVAEQTVSMVAREIAGQGKAEMGRNAGRRSGAAGSSWIRNGSGRPSIRPWDAAAVDIIELDKRGGHLPHPHSRRPRSRAGRWLEQRRGFFRRLNPFRGGNAAANRRSRRSCCAFEPVKKTAAMPSAFTA